VDVGDPVADVTDRGRFGDADELVVLFPVAGCVEGDCGDGVEAVDVVGVAALVECEELPAVVFTGNGGLRWEIVEAEPCDVGSAVLEGVEPLGKPLGFLRVGVEVALEVPGAERESLSEPVRVRNGEDRDLLAVLGELRWRVAGELAAVVALLVVEGSRTVVERVLDDARHHAPPPASGLAAGFDGLRSGA
jgi:hypothetical protein